MFQVASRTYSMCLTLTQPTDDPAPVIFVNYDACVAIATNIVDIEEHSREYDWTNMLR